jgi:hypothetical protein
MENDTEKDKKDDIQHRGLKERRGENGKRKVKTIEGEIEILTGRERDRENTVKRRNV